MPEVIDEFSVFFITDSANAEIYTISLHDALPILFYFENRSFVFDTKSLKCEVSAYVFRGHGFSLLDRKSTRLNSSHVANSYAAFCLKKKNLEAEREKAKEEHDPEVIDENPENSRA